MGILTKPLAEAKQRRAQNLSSHAVGVARLDETEPVDETASSQKAKEHTEDIRHEDASVQLPDPKDSRQMVGQNSRWTEPQASSDGSLEERDSVFLRNTDDDRKIKASSDNLQGDMEKKTDGPSSPGEEAGSADGGDKEDDSDTEEGPTEMTTEEKEDMREAVKEGDIDRLEELLDKPNADIGMVHFQENLLMTAIRAGQLQMAEFLLDNGVDQNFTTTMLNLKENGGPTNPYQKMEWYEYSCRQMAYDKGFFDIVEIIDVLNGRLFPGVKPRQRVPRYRRPPRSFSSTDDSDSESSSRSGDESDVDGTVVKSASDATPDLGTSSRDGVESVLRRDRRASSKGGAETLPREVLKDSEGEGIAHRRKNSPWGLEDKDGPATPDVSETVEVDSGHHSADTGVAQSNEIKKQTSGKKKRRKKKMAEGEKQPDDRGEEKRTIPKRSEKGDQVHEDAAKDVRRTARHLEDSRQQETDSKAGVGDEGYETMSPSPSWPPLRHQHLLLKEQPPAVNQTKATKASVVLKRTTENHLQRRLVTRYNEARPLRWRKVKSAGSYAAESPLWHHSLPPHLTPRSSSHLENLSSPSSSSSLSSPTLVEDQLPVSVTLEFKSIRVLEAAKVTAPKILRPSQRTLSSSESCESNTNSSNGTGVGGVGLSAARSTTAGVPQYPLKQRVPNYMRLTASTFVKRRLEPSFTSSYSSLDFVQQTTVKPSTNGSSSRHHVTSFSARSSTKTVADVLNTKSDVVTCAVSHRGKITRDAQSPLVSPRHVHAASRRVCAGSDVDSSMLSSTVPNIRNNIVVQPFRLASSLSKSR